jgi:hypothetical protein
MRYKTKNAGALVRSLTAAALALSAASAAASEHPADGAAQAQPALVADSGTHAAVSPPLPSPPAPASETLQVTLRFCALPVTAFTQEMRAGLVDRVATLAQVDTAVVYITSAAVVETTAAMAQGANQSSTLCSTTVVCVNVTNLTVSEAATASQRLSLRNFHEVWVPGGNGSGAVPLPNLTSAYVSVLSQEAPMAPPAPKQRRHHPHAQALAVFSCFSILVLMTIVRSLAIRHYETAMLAQVSCNTDVIVEGVSPTGSRSSSSGMSVSDWSAPTHRYERR